MKENNYLVVDKAILPDYYEKVTDAKHMLSTGEVKSAAEAAAKAGISRSTFYKYKDYVFTMNSSPAGRRANISMMLKNESGILSDILQMLSSDSYSVWTITQNPPIDGWANVVITLDVTDATASIDDLLRGIREKKGVSRVHLIGIE